MTARQYPFVLSNESLEWLNSRQEVTEAKARIQAKTSIMNNSISEYFSVPLTAEIRSELFEVMGLRLSSDIATIPMRWIAGDTPAHEDRGASSFSNTYLVYLTSSPGSFIVDGVSYPIQRGYGYVFSEGLSHETVGTTSDAGVDQQSFVFDITNLQERRWRWDRRVSNNHDECHDWRSYDNTRYGDGYIYNISSQ